MGDFKKILLMVACAAAVVYASNNVDAVRKVLGPKA